LIRYYLESLAPFLISASMKIRFLLQFISLLLIFLFGAAERVFSRIINGDEVPEGR